MRDLYLDAEAFVPERGERLCSVDCFVSPNEFWDWRNSAQLSLLRANWVEIDTRDHAVLTAEQEQTIVQEVFQQLMKAGIPLPSSYVKSGSGGIHLYWVYSNPQAAYFWKVSAWREVARKLCASLHGGDLWSVDTGASTDPARVMRVPGSVHGKSGRRVLSFVHPEHTISFDMLSDAMDVSVQQPNLTAVPTTDVKDKPKPSITPATNVVQFPKRHTIGQWWGKIYKEVVLKSKGGVAEGKRDATAFILYVALRHMYPSKSKVAGEQEQAFIEISRLNDNFIKLSQSELKSYLKTAMTTFYRYRKQSVAAYLEDRLGISAAFLFKDKKARLTPQCVKEAQVKAAIATASKRFANTLQLLLKTKLVLLNAGQTLTQSNVAMKAEVSIRTVKRYWSHIKEDGVIRSLSIYHPPGERGQMAEGF